MDGEPALSTARYYCLLSPTLHRVLYCYILARDWSNDAMTSHGTMTTCLHGNGVNVMLVAVGYVAVGQLKCSVVALRLDQTQQRGN